MCVSATKRALRFDKKAPAKKKTKRATIINGFGEASSSSSKARFVSKKRTLFLRERKENKRKRILLLSFERIGAFLRPRYFFLSSKGDDEKTMDGRDRDTAVLLKEQEEKLRAKYGGMIPKKNLIVSDKKHFDSADWSRSRQLGVVSSAADGAECDDEEILKPVLGAKDVPGTSPPSDASTFTTTNTSSKTKRRTSMDESRGRWDMNATTNTTVNSAYHAPAGASSGGK